MVKNENSYVVLLFFGPKAMLFPTLIDLTKFLHSALLTADGSVCDSLQGKVLALL